MNKFFASILVGLLLIAGIGGFVFLDSNPDLPDDTIDSLSASVESTTSGGETEVEVGVEGTGGAANATSAETSAKKITAAEIATHNSVASCWSSVNGGVYDLTSWISKHPGGPDKIVAICGTDGSAKFNGQHGGKAQQANVLAGFKIGVFAK